MRYARILTAVAGTPWAIHPEKGRAVMEFLVFAATGGKRSPAEVEAIIGRPVAYDDEETGEERRARMKAAEDQATADRGGIAVLGLKGVISPRLSDEMDISGPGGTSAEGFMRRLAVALDDSRVGGIIVDVDSPGGNVFGVPEAFEAMLAARDRKPVVAVANPFTASAAYWIAAGATELAVTPSGEVGSIGVYAYHEDLSKALADIGVVPTLVKADISPNKAETHPAFPLTDEAKASMQDSVNRYGATFLADVARGRGVKSADVLGRFGGGRMVGAEDAVAAGMADRVATLDQEIARMAEALARPAGGKRSAVADRRRRAAMW